MGRAWLLPWQAFNSESDAAFSSWAECKASSALLQGFLAFLHFCFCFSLFRNGRVEPGSWLVRISEIVAQLLLGPRLRGRT